MEKNNPIIIENIDTTPDQTSTNLITNGAITSYIDQIYLAAQRYTDNTISTMITSAIEASY